MKNAFSRSMVILFFLMNLCFFVRFGGAAEVLENKYRQNFIIVADSQFHNIFTDPNLVTHLGPDKVVPVSIRPPQLYLFAPDVLEYCLQTQGRGRYVIHLGDALNIACRSEWDMFSEVMQRNVENGVIKGWVMAPGNHDFFYFGNTPKGKYDEAWCSACGISGKGENRKPIQFKVEKDDFVELYIKALLKQANIQGDFGFKEEDFFYLCGSEKIIKQRPSGDKLWISSKNKDSFIKKISWYIDHENSWRSFIVQEIKLENNIHALVIDTCNYDKKPKLKSAWRNLGEPSCREDQLSPAFNGCLGTDKPKDGFCQLKVIDEIFKENNKVKYFVVGHHPHTLDGYINAMCRDAKESFEKIFTSEPDKHRFLGYISGHTHLKTNQKPVERGENGEWYELNIGSLTDWNMQYVLYPYENKQPEQFDEFKIKTIEACFGNKNYSEAKPNYTAYREMPYMKLKVIPSLRPKSQQMKNLEIFLITYYRMFNDLKVFEINTNEKRMLFADQSSLCSLLSGLKKYDEIGEINLQNLFYNPDPEQSFMETLNDLAKYSPEKHQYKRDSYKELDREDAIRLLHRLQVFDAFLRLEWEGYCQKRLKYGVQQAIWASEAENKKDM